MMENLKADGFDLAGVTVEVLPAITKWGFEDLGGTPELHRWRAWWAPGDCGDVGGIALCAYPVIKANPASVWINENGRLIYINGEKTWENFDPVWMKKRLCHNGSGSAWAKPTQDEAIHSLAVRLTRWAGHIARDVKKAKSAAVVLEKLCPERAQFSKVALSRLESAQAQTGPKNGL